MRDVKRYTDYGGMIDCQTDELWGNCNGVLFVTASDYETLERENAELRKQLEQAEGIQREIEAQLGCQKGGSIISIIHLKDAVRELYKRLEQAEARCKNLWDEIALLHGFREANCEATSPASPQADPSPKHE